MFDIITRLEFEQVFPEEKPKEILDYLSEVSSFMLLNIIGFSNTNPQPNYDNFASNLKVRQKITQRVNNYLEENNIRNKPELISREASLRLAEIILSNSAVLVENNTNDNKDLDELNIFKCFLIINNQLNSRKIQIKSDGEFDDIVDTLIAISFPVSDLGLFQDNNLEFGKLNYSTIVRFQKILDFLKSKEDYDYLLKSLYENFSLKEMDSFRKQVKFFFGQLLQIKVLNGFKFEVEDKATLNFLNSLVSDKIEEDSDFTALKNHPLYKLNNNTFSVIDYFFAIDKFFKSVRFKLKESYLKHNNLSRNDRSFFEFFNTKFSEEFLMKNLLDKLYSKRYFHKKQIKKDLTNEPDYYVRHNNNIFIFENKDVLIPKDVKSSGDIDLILKTLKKKFLKSGSKDTGIGQLVNSIDQIVNNNFQFDTIANTRSNFTIYPILILSDRIFMIPGLNYKLNQWYKNSVQNKLGEKYNSNLIKDLTIIDIDTLIFWLPHLQEKDQNFRKIIDKHLIEMNKKIKVNHNNPKVRERLYKKALIKKLSPISNRFNEYNFPTKMYLENLEEVFSD